MSIRVLRILHNLNRMTCREEEKITEALHSITFFGGLTFFFLIFFLGGHQGDRSIYSGLQFAIEKCNCGGRWQIQGHSSE